LGRNTRDKTAHQCNQQKNIQKSTENLKTRKTDVQIENYPSNC
jgi:hypothetical protein